MKKLLTLALLAAIFTGCHNNPQTHPYRVESDLSHIIWKGAAPDHYHVGSFKVTGSLATDATGRITSGDFIIPIASIEDFDLTDPSKKILLADLKDNFFQLATHPTAKFHLTHVDHDRLTGDFTLLGQTHPVSFPAKIALHGDSLVTRASFSIDRNQWGMKNYSDPKASLYILPQVDIQLNITAVNSPDRAISPFAFIFNH